jgi:hypothetical protein
MTTPKIKKIQEGSLRDPWEQLRKKKRVTVKSIAKAAELEPFLWNGKCKLFTAGQKPNPWGASCPHSSIEPNGM